jgi:ATP-dependent helicase/DNAse subunit B
LRYLLNKFFAYDISLFSSVASGFQPASCEASFGEDGKLPPLKIKAADGTIVTIRGKIDRIDLNEDKTQARIIDYKRSGNNLRLDAVNSAEALQLPLYGLAVTRATTPGSRISRLEYEIVNTAKSLAVYYENKIEESMNAARLKVLEYDADIRRGNFLVQPSDERYCRNCQQQKICRISELALVSQESNNHVD